MAEKKRCPFGKDDPLNLAYHDRRWCKPIHDERELFAMLELESFSIGLSWLLILRREKELRAAFDGFDPEICANYPDRKTAEILSAPGMIKNKGKIASVRTNALAFLAIEKEFGSFDRYLWSYSGGKTIDHRLKDGDPLPVTDPISDRLALDLKKRGFKYLGPTILYSYLQAVGIVNDHLLTCDFR